MKRTIERLSRDKEEIEEIVRDRNIEIYQLKQAPDTADFRKLVLEMANYLDEAESRQERQALILQDIGRMINVDFTDRMDRLKKILTITVTESEVASARQTLEEKYFINRATNTDAPLPRRRQQPSRSVAPKTVEALLSSPTGSIELPTEKSFSFNRVEVVKAIADSVIQIIRQKLKHDPSQDTGSPNDFFDIDDSSVSAFNSYTVRAPKRFGFTKKKPTEPPEVKVESDEEAKAKIKSALPKLAKPPVKEKIENSPPRQIKSVVFEKPQPDLQKDPLSPEQKSQVGTVQKEAPVEVKLKSHKSVTISQPDTYDVSVQTNSDWIQQATASKVQSIPSERKASAKISQYGSTETPRRSSITMFRSLDLPPIQHEPSKPVAVLIEPLKAQYPMIEANIYKLIEASLEEKAKFDLLDQDQGRPVRHMVECLLDFLYKQYGLKFLALKNFSALIEGLQKNIERPYIQLFCRLLGVFTNKPIGTLLGCFIVKARSAFVTSQRNSRARGLIKASADEGGEAYLSDLMECIPKLFSSSDALRQAGENVAKRLMEGKLIVELLPSLITSRISKANLDFNSFYNKLDFQRQGYVTQEAFIEGVRGLLELWIPHKLLKEYCTTERCPTFTLSQLTNKLWVRDPFVVLQSRAAIITKCEFLTHIVDAVTETEALKLEEIKQTFLNFQCEQISRSQYAEAVNRLAPNLSNAALDEMFVGYAFFPDEQLDLESWLELAKRYNLGGHQVVSERDDTIEHDKIIEFQHSEGHLAVQFNRKNTKYFKRR